ncbi:MAG: dihydrodipicolinate synthase family protein [Actinomycetota bacterium]
MVGRLEAKEWAKEHLKGLFSSPSAPFTQDFTLDDAGVIINVERVISAGASGVGFGFLEAWGLTIAQRKHVMDLITKATGDRAMCIFYTADHSVAETIALSRHAKAIGAEAIILWVPYEWATSQDLMHDYIEYVAGKVDMAIIAFNTPHSGMTMTHETMMRIAKIPNVCAFKNAIKDPQHTIRAIEMFGHEIVLSYPFEEQLLEMTTEHGQQVLLGSTSVYLMQSPERQPILDYLRLAQQGDMAGAIDIRDELAPLRKTWGKIYAGLWNENKAVHPMGLIKYWMDILGMAGGPLGPPMQELDETAKAAFREQLDAAGWERLLFPSRF